MRYLILFLLAGCSGAVQKLDPSIFYKRDIRVEVNGKAYEGVVTVPRSSSYNVTLKPQGNLDMVLVKSCHREDTAQKSTSGGFFNFKSKTEFSYAYEPRPGLENGELACPLTVDVYEVAKGRHSWAFIDFEHPSYSLPFQVDCNGHTSQATGVFVCQAKKGLVQRVSSPVALSWYPAEPAACAKPMRVSNYQYEIALSGDICVYMFDAKDGRRGRLTTIGYSGVLLREEI